MLRRFYRLANNTAQNFSKMTATAETTEIKQCARNGCTNPASGNQTWCKECRAKYQREYANTRDAMTYSRGFLTGFSEGAQAQRQQFLIELSRFPAIAEVSLMEVTDYLTRCPKPVYTAKPTEAAG